jgi:protein-disulfide isomerase
MFVLALFGLFVSAYLLVAYVSGGPIACGAFHGCDAVRLSEWASMFGLPTPALGVMFYSFAAAMLIVRAAASSFRPKIFYALTAVAAAAGFIESAYLSYVQAFEIGSYCTWCLASAVTAAFLFIAALADRPAELDASASARELKIQFLSLLLAAVCGAVIILALTSWRADADRSATEPREITEDARALLHAGSMTYKGPEDARVTIVEFLDFQCSACRAAYAEVKEALEMTGDSVRFTYRHFPLPSHEYALGAAKGAVCAEYQNALFPFVDMVMEEQGVAREDLIRYAAELRLDLDAFVPCIESREAGERVERDLGDGSALGISSAPVLFVNTTMIQGLHGTDWLANFIERELSGQD